MGPRPISDAVLMITPPRPARFISLTAMRVASITAVRSTSMARAQLPGSSANKSSPPMPALLNSMLSAPKCSYRGREAPRRGPRSW
jgi:hypothetical protein